MNRRSLIKGFGAGALALSLPRVSRAEPVSFSLHNKKGQAELLASLNQSDYWAGIEVERPSNQKWDEFKIKKLDAGYLTYISGTGNEDFTREEVVQTVLNFQHKLPAHMAGAKAMPYISKGMDPHFNVPYTDMLFMGDMDFFYCEYFQRMYRYDLPGDKTICAFEKVTKNLASAKRWQKYEDIKSHTFDTVDLRWPILNDIIEVTEVFGMYIVEPDPKNKNTTRVTLTAKLRFGDGTGMLAQWGSEMPYLVRSGTVNGFDASVAITSALKKGTYKMP